MPVKQILTTGAVPVKIWTDQVEATAMQQLENVSRLPVIHSHVAAMPDTHYGIGATVGSVIPTIRAIIPAAVGVDIGCGMIAARTTLRAEDLDERSLKNVFDQITRDVPLGRHGHKPERAHVDRAKPFEDELNEITTAHPKLKAIHQDTNTWAYQLGSLGTVSLIEKNSINNCQSTHYAAL